MPVSGKRRKNLWTRFTRRGQNKCEHTQFEDTLSSSNPLQEPILMCSGYAEPCCLDGSIDVADKIPVKGNEWRRQAMLPHLFPRRSLSRSLSQLFESANGELPQPHDLQTMLHRRPTTHAKLHALKTSSQSHSAHHYKRAMAESCSSSSTRPGPTSGTDPATLVSTAPTSVFSNLSSPTSQISNDARCPQRHSSVKLTSVSPTAAEDLALAAIEEVLPRYFTIPVQGPTKPLSFAPSVATVETTAAAKVFLETQFNAMMAIRASPRSLRRRALQQKLAELDLTDDERRFVREQWNRTESDHLRQIRVLKTSSLQRHNIKGISIAGYDVVRVLGKGSFGIVRLVTERADLKSQFPAMAVSGSGHPNRHEQSHLDPKEVYAMKVIRKSNMLRTSQEAHLRAERDFLVASENSRTSQTCILLTDRETRLCSRMYRFQEFRPHRRLHMSGHLSGANADEAFRRYVYSNGAEEIKAHQFFHGLPWNSMHLITPPFVPKIRDDQSITKYFEDEKNIISSSSSETSAWSSKASASDTYEMDRSNFDGEQLQNARDGKHKEAGMAAESDLNLQQIGINAESLGQNWETLPEQKRGNGHAEPTPSKKKKQRPRARDKILRDPVHGPKALELRKKGAFLGYTYRRIRPMRLDALDDLVTRKGQHVLQRPSIISVHGD